MNRMKMTLLLLLCLVATASMVQDLSGKWVGFLDQTAAAQKIKGYEDYWKKGLWKEGIPTCYMELELEEDGDSLRGTYHCAVYLKHDFNATFTLVGHLNSKTFRYKTTGILEEKSTVNKGFCHNSAELRYYEKDGFAYLEGTWEGVSDRGTPCADAVVKLQKKNSLQRRRSNRRRTGRSR